MNNMRFLFAPIVVALTGVPAFSQDAGQSADSIKANPVPPCLVVPALTPVSIEITSMVGSKISKSGDSFPIRLAAPIIINGNELVPAGATGVGEVIHAKGAGGMGAAGELVLAARYLEIDGRQLQLRSLRLPLNGKSKTDTVNTIAVVSAAAVPVAAFVGFLIKGGQIVVQPGTIADAKVAKDTQLPAHNGLVNGKSGSACLESPTVQ